jgi:hypothetical protein
MYFKCTCKISIGSKYVLRGVNSIEIKRSIHSIIQTATVKLPLSVVFRNNEMLEHIKLADKIKEGDSIKLEFGYNGNNRLEFEGYIKRIDYNMPLQLFCEDELYLLRKVRIKKAFGKCTLKELIQYLLDQVSQQVNGRFEIFDQMPQLTFSNFIMNNVSGIDVLQELKEKYGLRCYITTIDDRKILYCGLAYQLVKERVNYVLNKNTVSVSELKYDIGQDKRFKVKIKNYRKDGKVQAYEFGDKDGQEYEMQPEYGDYDENHMKVMAEAEMQRLQVQGFRGTFETMLVPYCQPGSIGVMTDPQFPDRIGNYYIAATTTTLNGGGGRRKPELGIKVSI